MVMRSADRILVLEKINPKNKDLGMIDSRVLTGENNLHAVCNPNMLWTLKYDHGILPPSLKQQWPDFRTLKAHLDDYFSNKNIKIKAVID